jgi:hypothetical protein
VDLLPQLLFPAIAVFAAVLAALLWRSRRGIAVGCAALAAASMLGFIEDAAMRAGRNDIRVDLLLLIPLLSVAAIVVGGFAIRAPGWVVRTMAATLLVAGGGSFGWFSWQMAKGARDAQHLTATFGQARKLYWEETIRCQDNLAKRFGTLSRHDPCYGHMVVKSRSRGAYPFSRAIVNDSGEVYLMFSPEPGIEDNWNLGDGPSAQLTARPDGVLSGETTASGTRVSVAMRPQSSGHCEAQVETSLAKSTLNLEAVDVAACDVPQNPPVRFGGAWGAVTTPKTSPQTRLLTQVWIWEMNGDARGLFLGNLVGTGIRIDYTFIQRLRGTRRAENEWELYLDDKTQIQDKQPFLLKVKDGHARLTRPFPSIRSHEEVLLDPLEVVSHPKIALVPVGDRDRFLAYFDSVFFNLNIPWTAP